MLRVTFLKEKDNILSFKIKGHASFAENGKDIVCSAISVLSQTTLASLLEIVKIDGIKIQNGKWVSISRFTRKYVWKRTLW